MNGGIIIIITKALLQIIVHYYIPGIYIIKFGIFDFLKQIIYVHSTYSKYTGHSIITGIA